MRVHFILVFLIIISGSCIRSYENKKSITIKEDTANNEKKSNIPQNEILLSDKVETCILPKNIAFALVDSQLNIPVLGDSMILEPDSSRIRYLHSYAKLIDKDGNEDFFSFLYHLTRNPVFQLERIKFPLKISILDCKQKIKSDYLLRKADIKYELFDEYIGLHWAVYQNSRSYAKNAKCIKFKTVTNKYIANHYFKRDSVWKLEYIQINYPHDSISTNPYGQENFDEFLFKFITDFNFQRSRVIFPYSIRISDISEDTAYVEKIEKEEWNEGMFKFVEEEPYYGIYFEYGENYPQNTIMKLRYSYNDNGISFGYSFATDKNGKWHLMESYDGSA